MVGEVPDWYVHIRAARYLGVAPWDLSEQPVFWRNAALAAENAEARHQQYQDKRANRKG